MGKKPHRSLSDHARDYLTAQDLTGVHDAPAAVQAAIRTSGAPLLNALSVVSDIAFIDDIIGRLEAQGLEPDLAAAAAVHVVSNPSLALQRGDIPLEVLQGVILQRERERSDLLADSDIRIVLRASLLPQVEQRGAPRQPPRVESVDVEMDILDIANDDDFGDVGRQSLHYLREYPMPRRARRERDPVIIVAGTADVPGNVDVPATWRDDLGTIGSSFAVDLRLESQSTNAPVEVPRSAHVVVLDPAAAQRVPDGLEGRMTHLDPRELPWQVLLRRLIVTIMGVTDDVEPPRSRVLAVGERVFHRKIRNSRKFDVFDDGADAPLCVHGIDSFDPWKKSPKAAKGMERRYRNFEAGMLRHCNKFPNCNVYAVFA